MIAGMNLALAGFTHDHLTGLREVAYDPRIKTLISNPVSELVNLRNGTLGGGKAVKVTPGVAHMVAGTGAPADASTADVVINITVPEAAESAAVGVNVLANASAGSMSRLHLALLLFLLSVALSRARSNARMRGLVSGLRPCMLVPTTRACATTCPSEPFGGILTIVNFTTPAADGSMEATASIRTLNPCGGGSSGLRGLFLCAVDDSY
eukprot:SAG31_NODE_5292_length_2628_cov_1.807434_1_plen_209_part_00